MKTILITLLVAAASCHFGGFMNFPFRPQGHLSPVFGGHHDAMAFFKHIGKFQRKIERKMAKFSAPIITEVVVVEDKSLPIAPFGSKYDICLDKLNVILDNLVHCARLCLDKRWQDTVPIVQRTVHLLIEDIKCFQNANKVAGESIDPQCIIDHLNKAADIVHHIFDDISRFDWNAAQQHIQELVETLADIRNC